MGKSGSKSSPPSVEEHESKPLTKRPSHVALFTEAALNEASLRLNVEGKTAVRLVGCDVLAGRGVAEVLAAAELVDELVVSSTSRFRRRMDWEVFFDQRAAALRVLHLISEPRQAFECLLGRKDLLAKLDDLALCDVELTTTDFERMASHLSCCRSLNLSSNELDNEVLPLLATLKPNLRHLDLSKNNLSDECGALLANLLGGPLVRLNLSGNFLLGKSVTALLEHLPRAHLVRLNLSNLPLLKSVSLVGLFFEKSPLQWLDLSKCELSDLSLFAPTLPRASSLRFLNLSSNRLLLAEPLRLPPSLEHLNLSRNKAKGLAQPLMEMVNKSALRKLTLKSMSFEAEDWQQLARALTLNTTLRRLVLSNNQAHQCIEASYGSLAQAMRHNAHLTQLVIADEKCSTHFHDEEAAAFYLDALRKNFSLVVLEGCSDDPVIQSVLRRNQRLQHQCRQCALLILWARTQPESVVSGWPVDLVRTIAKEIYETRGNAEWGARLAE